MKNEAMLAGVTVAGQPTDEELRDLQTRGFTTLINLRPAAELDEPEAPKVPAGVTYVEIPFNSETIASEHVAQTRAALEAAAGPVLVHCAGATRAAVVVAAAQAESAGEGAPQALQRAREAGFEIEGTPWHAFIVRHFEAASSA